jgi:acetylornithine deacetylase/succinyl-diaminopimelate desuccinylase family protein
MSLGEIFKSIDYAAIVDLTRELVRMPTVNPPGDCSEISQVLRSRMQSAGLETAIIEGQPGKTNVFGLLRASPATPRTILLSGHMDVVGPGEISAWRFEPFSATVAEEAIWGRGSVDMKGALAAQLFAVKALKESFGRLPVNVMLGATVDDEIAGDMGQKYVLERGLPHLEWPRPELHVLGEANHLNVTGEFKGRLWVRIVLQGKAAHGGAPQEGVNAIEKMVEYLHRVKELPRASHALLGADTMNLGTLHGGTRVNAVADECEATLDLRFSGRPAEEQRRRFHDALEEFQRQDGDFTVKEFSVFERRDPVRIAPEAPEVGAVSRGIANALGRQPAFLGTLSAGDAYHSLKAGIPAVWVGPGDIRQLHAPDEHMPLADLRAAAKVYASIVLAYAGIE